MSVSRLRLDIDNVDRFDWEATATRAAAVRYSSLDRSARVLLAMHWDVVSLLLGTAVEISDGEVARLLVEDVRALRALAVADSHPGITGVSAGGSVRHRVVRTGTAITIEAECDQVAAYTGDTGDEDLRASPYHRLERMALTGLLPVVDPQIQAAVDSLLEDAVRESERLAGPEGIAGLALRGAPTALSAETGIPGRQR